MTKPKPKQTISAFIPYYTHKPIEKPKSLHKGVIDCEYSSCGWMQRGKCECPNHRYEERIATLEKELKTAREQGKLEERERIWKAYIDFIVEIEGQIEMVYIRSEDEIEDFMRFQCGHPRLKSQIKKESD